MFNILTIPGKEGCWDPDEFFKFGAVEIEQVLTRLDDLGIWPTNQRRALDFGCGVGRLTQALSDHFAWAVGVDASKEMVERARVFANDRGCHKVGFRVNNRPDLKVFVGGQRDGFDFVYSVITLQHMPQELQRSYISDFVRVLRQGGLAVFQIPEGAADYIHVKPWLSMYPADRATVEGWVSDAGGIVRDVELSEHGGSGWSGWRYTVSKAKA